MLHHTRWILFVFLHLVISRPQINLDLTDQSENSTSSITLQHDCIHVLVAIQMEIDHRQVISYCLSELSSTWSIEENTLDGKFRFDELVKLDITSEDLYLWSGPLDVVERYQFYLNQRSISEEEDLSLGTEYFYNCTSSTFGPFCQYSLDGYETSQLSLNAIIEEFYFDSYRPTTLTCYTHLQCDRGWGICLDWSEICNGEIDCLNDGVDEKFCWQLQINKCNDDEYRCADGQCIPKTFTEEGDAVVDCLDQHDGDFGTTFHTGGSLEPSILNEDVRCLRKTDLPHITRCKVLHENTYVASAFTHKSVNDHCWFAFRCYFRLPDANHPMCRNICENRTCQEIINESCPDILFIPDIPLFFGHVYIAYSKEVAVNAPVNTLPPSYICYKDPLCGAFPTNTTFVRFNNTICRHPRDFGLRFPQGGRGTWLGTYGKLVYEQTRKCNTLIQSDVAICTDSIMYRCINSSKCILKKQVGDKIINCDYGDDEDQTVINSMCLNDEFKLFFYCTTTRQCLNLRYSRQQPCACGRNEYGICDDDTSHHLHITKHISFPTICDGFTELIPRLIDGRNETDETECEFWSCNNTYTRCDGFWNCLNGADEIDCGPSPLLNCSSQHLCASPDGSRLECLPLEKANNGVIDCWGATDEPKLCRSNNFTHDHSNFYDQKNNSSRCISTRDVCFGNIHCSPEYDYTENMNSESIEEYNLDRCNAQQFLLERPRDDAKLQRVNFSLNSPEKSADKPVVSTTSVAKRNHRCHRGFPLLVWLNKEKGLTDETCLCPPSYYGDSCQYQNQRVSLTMKLAAYSDSRQTLFAILITLIDHSDERVIHSQQQLSYLYVRDCEIKFNIYFLYSTPTKNDSRQYSLHFNIYEKASLDYRGSLLLPLKFSFLPVQRIAAQLSIPRIDEGSQSCSDRVCIHGTCIQYSNHPDTFCYCDKGWSGQYCNISHQCSCSNHSLCIGRLPDNRSICVCPEDYYGSRCLLRKSVCQSDSNENCLHGGACSAASEYTNSKRKFFCLCPKNFTGDRCEIPSPSITVLFHKDILLPQTITLHFVQILAHDAPKIGSTFERISLAKRSATVYWLHPYHIVFTQLYNNYYLIIVQTTYNASVNAIRTIRPSDRCSHISEVLNTSITRLDLIRRIKYYHLPCRNRTLELSCFYDDTHFCLCTDFHGQRVANCLEFNDTKQSDCFGGSGCKNGARCLQDRPTCPQTSSCLCPTCYYGIHCQFTSNIFTLSLDGILGYHIQPHTSTAQQPIIVQFSMALAVTMAILGLTNGILSLITFSNKNIQQTGCALYLLCTSINTLLLTIMFILKFWILIIAQINYITNRSFLIGQCLTLDFLLRVGLNMDQWLNACVAMERAVTIIRSAYFNRARGKQVAKYVILLGFFAIIGTNIYDPLNRDLTDDMDDSAEKRIWCTVSYSSGLNTVHSALTIFHFFAPFMINIVSTSVIIFMLARQQRIVHRRQSKYRIFLQEQMKQHKNLFIAPFVLTILAIPRLVISLVSGCMKSINDSWLFLIGYFISFFPSMLTFVVFVLPSTTYKNEFNVKMRKYKWKILSVLSRRTP